MAIYTDCGGELVGELFRTETIGGSMRYLPYSIEDDNNDYHGGDKLFWTKILLI